MSWVCCWGAWLLPRARLRLIETNVFAVTGVDVDITDTDATTAKNKAIIEAQIKGFRVLAERFGGQEAVAKFEKLTAKDVGKLLRSLSIEEERTGPGRYIGKLTVRFLPHKVRELFGEYGLPIVEEQSPPIVLLPVWKTGAGRGRLGRQPMEEGVGGPQGGAGRGSGDHSAGRP